MKKGHIDCVKYLHENNCKWNIDTMLCAVKNGHLDCVKYAHENGCPWDRRIVYIAVEMDFVKL